MIPVKSNAPWHRLLHTHVGRTYPPAFYEPIKNHQVRESLQRIANETEEDYQVLIQALTGMGVTVSRPTINVNSTIMDYIDSSGRIDYMCSQSYTLIPRPPMQPRDSFLVVDDVVLETNSEAKIMLDSLDIEKRVDPWINYQRYRLLPEQTFDAPLATVVGDRIIVDCREHGWLASYFKKAFPDHQIRAVYIGGHNDAVYAVIKPGVLISTYHHDNYRETFPGWQVKHIENQSWNAIPNWRKIKHSNINRYWLPEEIDNREFSHFLDTWLSQWLGYVQETVFDINVLQIDQSTVLVNNYNKEMFAFLAQHGVEAVVVPFRHRFFWDGGLHCITNDIYRQGDKENYF